MRTSKTAPLLVMVAAAVGFGIYGTLVESRFTWFYAPLTIGYAALVWWLDRRFRFSHGLLWALTAAAVGNLTGGVLILGGDQLYSITVFGPVAFDDIQHSAATGIVAVACWWLLGQWLGTARALRAVAAVLMAAGLGTVIEIAEFIGSSLWDTNVGGYGDSMVDLVSNLAGATLSGLLLAWRNPAPD